MLSVAEEYLHELNSSTELMSFGQELNDQTFAICKADMLIKGNNADFIKDGNTLSDDQFEEQKFDYIISNPPFGREWKNEKRVVEDEAKRGFAGRFGAGLPAASDGQMLFLMTAISKMKEPRDGGSRIAIIHNGSPLFTGDAGSGSSDIRQYILESDLLEAIVAMPNDIFYNTGIALHIYGYCPIRKQERSGKVKCSLSMRTDCMKSAEKHLEIKEMTSPKVLLQRLRRFMEIFGKQKSAKFLIARISDIQKLL